MRDDYRNQMASKIAGRYQDLELRIMQDIVRRIKKAGEITSTADWQINRLQILGYSSEDIEKEIKTALDASYPEMFELYDEVINWEYVRNKGVYEQINAEYIPFEQNKQLQQITNAIIEQSLSDLENVTRSMGFYLDYGSGKKVMTPLSQVYAKYLDAACMDIVSGAFDYNSVLRRTVTQLTNSGLRKIDYASGRADRVDVAARRAVMTGVSQITGRIAEYNADILGTEYFEVAWHAGARPTHAVWQGQVWSKRELYDVCGLGTVTGLLGVNCYHEYYPFFPGISERNWSDEWLAEQNRLESEPKEFRDKRYTLYEAKQRQRQMETAMRAQREKVRLLQSGGADPQEVMLMRAKYQGQLNEYSRFCRKMGLTEERERIYLDMRGRVASDTRKLSLNDTSDKWKRAAKAELKKDEKSLSWRKKETAVIYDSNGKYLFTKRGDERSVDFTWREIRKMRNCIVSHNHPSGASFSIADWKLFKKAKLQELRAIGENEVYYIRVDDNTKLLQNMPDDEFIELCEEMRRKVRKEYQKLYKSGKISKQERLLLSSDEYNRLIAEKVGVKYGKEYF